MNAEKTPYIVDGILYAADFPVEFSNTHLENTGPVDCANCSYFGCNENGEFFGYCLNCITLYEEERPVAPGPHNNEHYCQVCYSKLSKQDTHVCDYDDVDTDWVNPEQSSNENIKPDSRSMDVDDYVFIKCEHGGSTSHSLLFCSRIRCECTCHGCWFSRYPEFYCMHQFTQCVDVATCECSCERCFTSDDKRDLTS